jgi:hypothetical protein
MCGAVLFAAAGIATGSGKPKTEKVGKVTKAQVEVRLSWQMSVCGRFWGLTPRVCYRVQLDLQQLAGFWMG